MRILGGERHAGEIRGDAQPNLHLVVHTCDAVEILY